ncbi:hypothetical protein J3R30DRAFT_1519874 [Lentinula aciculospora]|uniref:F-box domain-containing protein n=1 Tax=Lentinula aciculospora TaxID=153920 RepID=A0A9W8ZY61_9AGAR|nr:hypothetical protein J3R30DRAFT_1519874 [Lentinula aciculospora]
MSPALPLEILNSIIELVSDNTPDLKTCSLVSPAWHAATSRIRFSELHLLCSVEHPKFAAPQTKPKRQFDLAYGILPVYRKKWPVHDRNPHCICSEYQDRTVQSFCSSGASSLAHVTSNVTRLKLMFCISSSTPEPVNNGPHSLQLYPDSTISYLLQLIDGLSFVHLRFLIIDSAPQVLYFMPFEPFGGVLSSAASSLEEIHFTSFESMQNSDIKRLLNKHTFSCTRFPRLRRLLFQGLFRTNTLGLYGPQMSCALEFTRAGLISQHGSSPFSVSVGVSYSLYWDALTKPDGFSRFEIPGWCCFSGICTNLQEPKSLVEVMSLGTGVRDWSLPTIGLVLGAFQSDTLSQFARALDVKVSSDVNDPSGTKLFTHIIQAYPRISSLNLSFNSIVDMRLVLSSSTKQSLGQFPSRTTTIMQHLLAFPELSLLQITLYGNAGFMVAFALDIIRNQSQNQNISVQIQDQLEVVSALDTLLTELALASTSEQRNTETVFHTTLQEIAVVVDTRTGSGSNPTMADSDITERELKMLFSRTTAACSNILTFRAL